VRQSERANPSNLSTDSKFSDMLRTLSRKPFGVDSYHNADALIDRSCGEVIGPSIISRAFIRL
jgi:hypothetical protein